MGPPALIADTELIHHAQPAEPVVLHMHAANASARRLRRHWLDCQPHSAWIVDFTAPPHK